MVDIFSSLPILIFMPFFATIFVLMSKKDQPTNIYNVCMLAIVANIIIVWRFFYLIDTSSNSLQLLSYVNWLQYLNIKFVFGADVFSLFLILAIHIAFLITLSGIKDNTNHPKTVATFSMIFLSMITGLFISCDLFSFYLFFEALLIPVFLLTGIGGGLKKQEKSSVFFMYNTFFSLILFVAIIILYNQTKNNYVLTNISKIKANSIIDHFVWITIFVSLLSRLPIWPFHRMLSSINSEIKTSLVFLISNLMPLTAVYGFIRLTPNLTEINMQIILDILIIITIISMLFISLISFAHKDFQYKMFSYTSIVYLFYLIAILSGNSQIHINISLSFFAFILAVSGIKMLRKKYEDNNGLSVYNKNILKFLLFSLLGAPLSSVFLNNLAIFSSLYKYGSVEASLVFLSFIIAGSALLSEVVKIKHSDLDKNTPKVLVLICLVLLMSFLRPLWFVEL